VTPERLIPWLVLLLAILLVLLFATELAREWGLL